MTWNDLSTKEALQVLTFLSLEQEGAKIPFETRLFWIADYLSKGKLSREIKLQDDDDIKAEILKEGVEEYAHPFFDIEMVPENPDPKIISLKKPKFTYKLSLTKCPYPTLEWQSNKVLGGGRGKRKIKKYYAAADGLTNVSIHELSWIFNLLEAFGKNGEEQVLSNLLAVVYRPGKKSSPEGKASGYNGDRRRVLVGEESTIAERSRLMDGLAKEVRNLLWFWLVSCREAIIAEYPIIFDTDAVEKEVGEKDYGWGGLLLTLSDGIVGFARGGKDEL